MVEHIKKLLKKCTDNDVTVEETGLHIHKAALPSMVSKACSKSSAPYLKEGSLMMKHVQTNFCFKLEGDEVVLKKDHAYYYQVQGQMAVIGTHGATLSYGQRVRSHANQTTFMCNGFILMTTSGQQQCYPHCSIL